MAPPHVCLSTTITTALDFWIFRGFGEKMGKHNNRKRFRGRAVRANPIEAEPSLAENGHTVDEELGADVLSKVSTQLQSG